MFYKIYIKNVGVFTVIYNPFNAPTFEFSNGVPWGIRTLDLLLRRQLLYPTELKVHLTAVATTVIISVIL